MLNKLIDDMVETIRPYFTDKISIARYTGRFTEADLDHYAGRAPVLLVSAQLIDPTSCNQITRQALHDGDADESPRKRINAKLSCAIAVLTKDMPEQSRDEAAIDLIYTLLQILPHNTFENELSCGVDSSSIRCRNLHTMALNKKSVTLWGVTFEQMLRLEFGEPPTFVKPAQIILGANDEV